MSRTQPNSRFWTAGWWSETETPRWAIAFGAIAMFFLTLAGTYALNGQARVAEQRAEQVRALVDSAVQFQVFASAFATEMNDEKRVATATRSRLVENLNDQIARLRVVEVFLPESARPEIENYRRNLLAMGEAVQNASDIISMKQFWSSASNLTVARNRLNSRLQANI